VVIGILKGRELLAVVTVVFSFSAAPVFAVSVAGTLSPGVAVGGAAEDPGLSLGFGAEVAAGPFNGFEPVFSLGYDGRNYRDDRRLVGDWDRTVGRVGVYRVGAGCEYAFLQRESFSAFGTGGFLWAWERAKLWDIEGLNYKPWEDSAAGLYAGAGVEFRSRHFSFALKPSYTVLFDNPPVRFDPGTQETTLTEARSQFVDVLFRVKYSF